MATYDLTPQFRESQRRINLGERAKVARAAHLEVAAVLQEDPQLVEKGLTPALIGSYARETSIWPGKDVDVFGKLERCDIHSIRPDTAYGLFRSALAVFGDRLEEQPRSLKVKFGPEVGYPEQRFLEAVDAADSTIQNVGRLDFAFSVDVVPAVHWDDEDNWGIPTRDVDLWLRASPQERWVKTNPEALTDLTRALNRDVLMGADGAFVPTVKAMKQIKVAHLGKAKPSALFVEFMLHEGCRIGDIHGDSWADLTQSALRYVVDRLRDALSRPVRDPVLDEVYQPVPSADELARAAELLDICNAQSSEALTAERCRAAYLWRQVLGANGHEGHDSVFPLPDGCRADGTVIAATAANPLRGGSRERGFGAT